MSIIKLPGLIDPHVHLRDPGQTEKEDFYTGSRAAIAGGFTTILDMPNNKIPITTLILLKEKIKIAKQKTACDIGFYFGSIGDNLEEFDKVKNLAYGLKLYLNQTTGGYIINEKLLRKIYKEWNRATRGKKPILLHAEEDVLQSVEKTLKETKHPTHICHVSSKKELTKIIQFKKEGLPITCGVTPHHLFLTEDDLKKAGPYGLMKPSLKTKHDQEYLWKNLQFIDIVESDHAPHTIDEKESVKPPFGVTGLETTLPLLLTAVAEKRLTINDIIRLCYTNPAKIFNIKFDYSNNQTKVEVDLSRKYTIKNENLFTKCKWSPFNGWKAKGKVDTVFIRGIKVFENDRILTNPGSGKII